MPRRVRTLIWVTIVRIYSCGPRGLSLSDSYMRERPHHRQAQPCGPRPRTVAIGLGPGAVAGGGVVAALDAHARAGPSRAARARTGGGDRVAAAAGGAGAVPASGRAEAGSALRSAGPFRLCRAADRCRGGGAGSALFRG